MLEAPTPVTVGVCTEEQRRNNAENDINEHEKKEVKIYVMEHRMTYLELALALEMPMNVAVTSQEMIELI